MKLALLNCYETFGEKRKWCRLYGGWKRQGAGFDSGSCGNDRLQEIIYILAKKVVDYYKGERDGPQR